MSTLQDLIASLSADGFTADEGQQIINAAGGDLQSISDASGVSLDEINSFISANNLQLPVANNNNNNGALDLSNLTGLLNYDPYTVPQGSMPSGGGSVSSGSTSAEDDNKELADIASTTYNTLTNIKNASAVQAAVNAGDLAAGALLMPGLGLFATAVNLMGIFDKKKDWGPEDYSTQASIDIMEGAIQQAQQQMSTDARGEDTEGAFGVDTSLIGDLQDTLKKLYAQKAEEEGAYDPEGFVRDEQGFLRDRDTNGYWILTDTGGLMRTTPPLVPVPMPEDSMTLGGDSDLVGDTTKIGDDIEDAGLQIGDIVTDDRISGDYSFIYDAEQNVFHYTPFDEAGNRIYTGQTIDASTVAGWTGTNTGETASILFENGSPYIESSAETTDSSTDGTINITLNTTGAVGADATNIITGATGGTATLNNTGSLGTATTGTGGGAVTLGDGAGPAIGPTQNGGGGNVTVINGTDGQDGSDGVDGTDGRDGVDGRDGADGADGAKGDKGDKGDKGERGAAGVAGLTAPFAQALFGDEFQIRDVLDPKFIGLLNLRGRR